MAIDNFSYRSKILFDPTQEYIQPSVLVQIFGPEGQLVTERYLAFTIGEDTATIIQQRIQDAVDEVLNAIDTSQYREDLLDVVEIADTDINNVQGVADAVSALSDRFDTSDAARSDEVDLILDKIADLRNQPLQLAKLDLVYTQIQDLSNVIATLNSDGATTRSRAEEIQTALQTVASNIVTILASPVDGKVTTVLSRLNDVESAITPLYTGQTGISDALITVLSQSQTNGTAVAAIKSTAEDTKALVTSVQTALSDQNTLTQNVEIDVQDLAATLDTFITQTDAAISDLADALVNLSSQLAGVSNQIAALAALHEG